MGIRSGDIRQFTLNGREFAVKGGDANVNIDIGGFTNESGVSGSGVHTVTMRRKAAGFSDCPLLIDDTNQDLEYIQGIANTGLEVPVTLTLVSDVTYSGSLAVIGDIMKAAGDGTMTLEMRGSKFEQL